MGLLQATETGSESSRPAAAFDLDNVIPWLACLVVAIGSAVLIFGWGFGFQKARTIGPWVAGMAPSTSISFILSGIALLCVHRLQSHEGPATASATVAMAAGIGLTALTNLSLLWLTPYHGIEELFLPRYLHLDSVYMASATAISFIAVAICLLALIWTNPKRRPIYSCSATLGLVVSVVAITAYVFAADPSFELFLFTAMALHTAVGFALVFVGLLLLRPEWSWIQIVVGEGEGSAAVRRLLPPVLLAPFILAWLGQQATERELITENVRLSLITMLIVTVLVVFLLWNGALQNKVERELRHSLQLLRETVAERDLLLREVYHRVKNNLQQIDALIAIESLQIEDQKAKESFRATGSRVRALGAVHQMLLSSNNLSSFGVDMFLQDLCADIARGLGTERRGIELRVDAQPEVVELDYAIPLGLLVNELVTNAFKYAFPGDGGGRIEVEYRLHEAGGATLRVSDNGIGISADKMVGGTGGSVGSVIIQSLVGQLRAEMTVDGSDGTTICVAVPAGVSRTRT